jgi:hypothetical protein
MSRNPNYISNKVLILLDGNKGIYLCRYISSEEWKPACSYQLGLSREASKKHLEEKSVFRTGKVEVRTRFEAGPARGVKERPWGGPVGGEAVG